MSDDQLESERELEVLEEEEVEEYDPDHLKSFFSYFGGKAKISKKYPEPSHKIIVEPFAGAAGYSTRHYKHDVKLFDLDPVIVSIWEFLIGASYDDIMKLPITFDKPINEYSNKIIPYGAKNLIGFWINRGRTSPAVKPSSWMLMTKDDGTMLYPGSFWGKRVQERIAKQVEVISHWDIFGPMSYQNIGQVIVDYPEITWHIDPPYFKQGVAYKRSAKSLDFEHLGNWVTSLKGEVMVCENAGAPWLEGFVPLTDMHNSHRQVTKEVIWTNFGWVPEIGSEETSPEPELELAISPPLYIPSTPELIETLTCVGCGSSWDRELKRGRKPVNCPDCLEKSNAEV